MTKSSKCTTEYLIVLDKRSVGAYYNLINTSQMLNKLLENEANIKVVDSKIKYNKEVFDYKVRHGVVNGKEQRYFYASISTDINEFDNYTKLLADIRKTFLQQGFIVETLQDDVSFFYSQRAYSLIHEIENLMRKFITFFMITNVGKDWVSDNTPHQVKIAIEKCKPRDYASELQKLDFKDLGNFLFDKYQKSENGMLHRKIASYKTKDEIVLDDLKSFVPRSNWDIYFKECVDFEGSSLEKKWQKLYELRNGVAHTSSLTRTKYEDIVELVDEVRPVLMKAFNSLDKLNLEPSDKAAISDRVATALDEKVAAYFSEFNQIEESVRALSPESHDLPFGQLLKLLRDGNSISELAYNNLSKLLELKGTVSSEIFPSVENINRFAVKIDEVHDTIQESWSNIVYYAIKELGGKAKLEEIYLKVEEKNERNLFGSWKTSVRRAIYTHSSDVELYNGKYDIYKQVSKGAWMIRSNIDPLMLNEFLGVDDV
ncbi:hypothetical protein [Shewanella algae]|uniref:hypothetical protein n=1 Tax=Shewanella algae TaxID=38313 RepID=UPI0031F59582